MWAVLFRFFGVISTGTGEDRNERCNPNVSFAEVLGGPSRPGVSQLAGAPGSRTRLSVLDQAETSSENTCQPSYDDHRSTTTIIGPVTNPFPPQRRSKNGREMVGTPVRTWLGSCLCGPVCNAPMNPNSKPNKESLSVGENRVLLVFREAGRGNQESRRRMQLVMLEGPKPSSVLYMFPSVPYPSSFTPL